ncbi:MAG: hypothetical protein R6X02_20515 [Enhygromyxa sp.]
MERLWPILATLLVACGADEPPLPSFAEPPDIETINVYESTWVEVFAPPGAQFCRGDGAQMDAQVERLSMLLELDPAPQQIPVYVVRNQDADLINEWCFGSLVEDRTLGGCFRNWMVVAQPPWVPHELNHAVLHALSPRIDSAFWLEAYASAWEPERSVGMYFDSLPGQEVVGAYTQGNHFVRWLTQRHGIGPVRDFYSALEFDWDRSDIDAAFADVFGVSYEESLIQYEANVAPIYPGFGWCEGVEVIDVPFGETQVTLGVDCDAPDTHAFYHLYPIEGMYVRRVLRLEQAANLEIEYSPYAGILKRHPCLETPVESEDDPRLANSAWDQFIGTGVPAIGPVTVSDGIPAGDNLFEFVVPLGEPLIVEATIRAEPSDGG